MPLISIVVPCYNEQEALPLFAGELSRIVDRMATEFGGLSFEAVFVDDGSSDGTLRTLKGLAGDGALPFAARYLSFSRNFGKEAAIYAGL